MSPRPAALVSRASALLALLLCFGCQGELAERESLGPDAPTLPPATPPLDPPGGGGEDPADMALPPALPEAHQSLGVSTLRLLTPTQYVNAARQLTEGALELPPVGLYNSSLAAASGGLNDALLATYEEQAYAITAALFPSDAALEARLGCAPSAAAQDPCTRGFLADFGRLAWRRPLTEAELDRYATLSATLGERLGSPHQGVSYATAGLLQSPHFLYRVELGAPDSDQPGRHRYDPYEVATRLAFFLTDAPPDRALLDQASRDALRTPEALEQEARRLLATPAGDAGLRRLGVELFGLDALPEVEKDPGQFPMFSRELAEQMAAQLALTFTDHVRAGRDYRELFTRRDTFMNDALAPLYGLEPTFGPELVPYTFPAESGRRGVLTLAALMTLHSGLANTSPTNRGFFVRTDLLCHSVPPPGPEIDTTLPVPMEGERLTNRELLSRHVVDPSCAGCHQFMDPLGFPLENFDPVGRWRATQNEKVIDPSGALDGQQYIDAVGFGEALAAHPDLVSCLTEKLFAHAFARLTRDEDDALLAQVVAHLAASDYDLREALIALAISDAMRFAEPPQGVQTP